MGPRAARQLSWKQFQQLHAITEACRQKRLITTRKRSLGQGNIFSSVCQEFCSGGSTWAGTPQAGTPLLGRYTPPGRYPPGQVHPPGRYTPWQVHPREQCMLGDTGNKRAVRILLDCILVSLCYQIKMQSS